MSKDIFHMLCYLYYTTVLLNKKKPSRHKLCSPQYSNNVRLKSYESVCIHTNVQDVFHISDSSMYFMTKKSTYFMP